MLNVLDEYYSLDEFRELCFNLGVDYDNLGGEGKRAKARELLLLIYRQDRLAELLAQVGEDRPTITLPDLPTLRKQAKAWRKVSTRAERVRQTLIQNVRSVWVEGVLHHANDILLSLDLTYTPDALQRDVPILLQDDAGETAVNISLLDVFAENGRRLLILGEPGSGKTFTLLQLTEDLLDQADRDLTHPVPVVLNLSSWALTRKPLPEWVAEEMLTQYQVARKVTKAWLEQDELLLMLDGLDEVNVTYRNECLVAINEFMAEHQTELVVCSRIGDYEQLKHKLNVSTAVRIQSLTDSEVTRYLSQPGLKLQAILEADSHLYELAHSPLMLTVMTLAYQGLSPEELTLPGSAEEQRQQLFGKYVEQVFKRRPMGALHNNLQWLTHLAKGMSQEQQSVFYIERLQPTWLPSKQWYLALRGVILMLLVGLLFGVLILTQVTGLLNGLVFGLLAGLLFGLIGGLFFFLTLFIQNKKVRFYITAIFTILISGALWGMFFGLYMGLIGAILIGVITIMGIFDQKIDTVEALSFTVPHWRDWMIKFGQGALLGFIFALISQLLFGLLTAEQMFGGMFGESIIKPIFSSILEPDFGMVDGLVLGLIYILILGVLAAITTFIKPREIEKKSRPNQGIHRSIKNALSMLIITGLLLGIISGIVDVLFFGSITMILFNSLAFFVLPISLFYYGGITIVRHYSLRITLASYRILPLKLVPLLDTMADRIILRKVGGGYIFIHRYLLEYFAGLSESAANKE